MRFENCSKTDSSGKSSLNKKRCEKNDEFVCTIEKYHSNVILLLEHLVGGNISFEQCYTFVDFLKIRKKSFAFEIFEKTSRSPHC